MIVTTTETIPGKKIVQVLGTVHAKESFTGGYLVSPEMAQRKLAKEAEKLGANAIVGLKIEEKQRTKHVSLLRHRHYSAYGTAVIVEEEKGAISEAEHGRQAGQMNYCPKCGARLPDDAVYCPVCGHKMRS